MAVFNGLASGSGQVRSFRLLLDFAREADAEKSVPEMQHFSRWVFAQSRYRGELNDPGATLALWSIARAANAGVGFDVGLFRLLALALGWRRAALLADAIKRRTTRKSGARIMLQSWMQTRHGDT